MGFTSLQIAPRKTKSDHDNRKYDVAYGLEYLSIEINNSGYFDCTGWLPYWALKAP